MYHTSMAPCIRNPNRKGNTTGHPCFTPRVGLKLSASPPPQDGCCSPLKHQRNQVLCREVCAVEHPTHQTLRGAVPRMTARTAPEPSGSFRNACVACAMAVPGRPPKRRCVGVRGDEGSDGPPSHLRVPRCCSVGVRRRHGPAPKDHRASRAELLWHALRLIARQ